MSGCVGGQTLSSNTGPSEKSYSPSYFGDYTSKQLQELFIAFEGT